MGLSDRKAIRLYNYAIERGVSYFDTAPGYGTAHQQLAASLIGRRNRVILTSKAPTSDGTRCTELIEGNLKSLQTDYLDIAYIHSAGDQNIDEMLDPGGALEALCDIKRRGLARFIGVTAHNRPHDVARLLKSTDMIDVVMFAMNPVESNVYDFEHIVLPIAREKQIGIVAMKVYGGTTEMVYKKPAKSALAARERFEHELAFRYALSVPGVSCAVIGMYHRWELDANLAYLERFQAFSDEEAANLLASTREAATRWGERYGPAR